MVEAGAALDGAREAGANAWQLHKRAWNNEFAPEKPWDPTVLL